jgi:hypothetical protein
MEKDGKVFIYLIYLFQFKNFIVFAQIMEYLNQDVRNDKT